MPRLPSIASKIDFLFLCSNIKHVTLIMLSLTKDWSLGSVPHPPPSVGRAPPHDPPSKYSEPCMSVCECREEDYSMYKKLSQFLNLSLTVSYLTSLKRSYWDFRRSKLIMLPHIYFQANLCLNHNRYIPPSKPSLHGMLGYKCHILPPQGHHKTHMSLLQAGYCMYGKQNACSSATMDTLCMEDWSCKGKCFQAPLKWVTYTGLGGQ